MSEWAVIHLPTLIVAVFIAVAVVAVAVQLGRDKWRAAAPRRAHRRHTLLDKHGIPYKEDP